MDRWNPAINWKENSMPWKMGKRMIKVTVESISAQRMRKIAQREPVFFMVIKANEDTGNIAVEET